MSRPPLKDLNQNLHAASTNEDGTLVPIQKQAVVGKISSLTTMKPNFAGVENINIFDQGTEDLAKLVRERDNLADEVRKLTRQNAQLMNTDQSSSWQRILASNRELRRLEDELIETRQTLEFERQNSASIRVTVEELKKEASEAEILRNELNSYKDTIKKLVAAREQAVNAQNELKVELATTKESSAQFILELQCRMEELKSSNAELQQQLQKSIEQRPVLPSNIEEIQPEMLASITSTVVKDLQDKLLKSETIRKQLLNKVHELKGNIRVFVRCRPFLPNDGVDYSLDPNSSPLICCEETNDINIASMLTKSGTPQMFHFDQVFGQSSSQNQIFESVSDLIQSALDGYRVCIFCYGQTGSGKTHTMSGSAGSAEAWGIIPRAVQKMIQDVASMREAGWEIELKASMLEVYNETIRDILSAHDETAGVSSDEKQSDKKYRISYANGKVSVSDVVSVQIDTTTVRSGMKKLHEIMLLGNKNRMVASTSMNDRSSRSHLLFYLDVTGHHPGRNTWMEGGLRLVDLAGSERLDRCGTGNDASRFRETVSINKSLSSLGEVFLSLGNKLAHVPFRNSKLTMLLQVCQVFANPCLYM
jgi:kinesin family protein C1